MPYNWVHKYKEHENSEEDNLEQLSEEYEAARKKLTHTIANKLDSLARKMHENNLTNEVFVCEIDSVETYENYYITARGLCDYKNRIDLIYAATEFIDYFQTEDLVDYVSRAETRIDRIITRKNNQRLADNLDFSYFFNSMDNYDR